MATLRTEDQLRGIEDRTFYWSTVLPLEWTLGVTGSIHSYIEVTSADSYHLAITPDLNHLSLEGMFTEFTSYNKEGNSRLLIKKDLSIDNGNLIYDGNLDSFYTTISEDEMERLIFTDYHTFIWRVRSVNKFGQVSNWSEPSRFRAILQADKSWIKVDPIPEFVHRKDLNIKGTKSDLVESIIINDKTYYVTNIDNHRWTACVELLPGLNKISVKGKAKKGLPSDPVFLETTLRTLTQSYQSVPNTFDHFGTLYGLDRLFSQEENNSNYLRRIKDIFVHPAGSNLLGLHYSCARELDLDFDDYAIIIKTKLHGYEKTDSIFPNLTVDISANYFSIMSDRFYIEKEEQYIDNQDLSITLNQPLHFKDDTDSLPVKIFDSKNIEVERNQYEIDYFNNKVIFKDSSFLNKKVWATYFYKIRISLIENKTLSALVTKINQTTFSDLQILEASLSEDRSGYESVDGLYRFLFSPRSNSRYTKDEITYIGSPIRWTDIAIFPLIDKEYWERFKNEDLSLLNSKIESYVNEFKDKSHRTWNSVVLDSDVWDADEDVYKDESNLPVLWDSIKGYWKSTEQSSSIRYSQLEAFVRSFKNEINQSLLKWYGLEYSEIKSGIGRDNDLKVVIEQDSVKEILTEPSVFRATVSWQITGQVDDANYFPGKVYGSGLFTP